MTKPTLLAEPTVPSVPKIAPATRTRGWRVSIRRLAALAGLAVSATVGLSVAAPIGPVAAEATYETFDPPNSVRTSVTAINDSGVVIGSFREGVSPDTRAFVRDSDGSIVTFDAPNSTSTGAVAINDSGVITGSFRDLDSGQSHAYVRDTDGSFTTFAVMDGDAMLATSPAAINNSGAITGLFEDPINGQFRGFLRYSNGNIVTFDPADSVDTVPSAINDSGQITGYYLDNSAGDAIDELQSRGFVRNADGSILVFDEGAPDSATFPRAINSAGLITGDGGGCNGPVSCGFVRESDGSSTQFAVTDADVTRPEAINDAGVITGSYSDIGIESGGFVRANDGTITTFAVPGSDRTNPDGITDEGVIAGEYFDIDTDQQRGFVRTPAEACQPGTFSATGHEPCTEASAGSFVNESGATSATPCPVGTFSGLSGATSCTDAPVGFYVDTEGATAPTECPPLFTTEGTGSESSSDCFPIDSDGDGVPDIDDVCDGTVLPDEPTVGLRPNRYRATTEGFVSDDGAVAATLADTGGCSAAQIIEELGLGGGHTKFGISKGELNSWIASLG